jgi:hypothetical protein
MKLKRAGRTSIVKNIPCKRYKKKTKYYSVMPSKVYSAAVVGVEAFEVEFEVHAGRGDSDKITVVGLPDTAAKESKDRVTSAIPIAVCTGRRERGLQSIWPRPMSGRKDPALICRLPSAC